ncbi:DUF1240 domain-containing protein [Xenorhabdus khoisanae]|uniref:DUF1240 domain-containing protein n=1 Tax=Xenorhabdus khoisanae TaxID=880157 RepID=UPI0032B7451D
MNNKNRLTLAIGMFFLFLIINAALFFAIDDFLSLYHISNVVVFSWRVFAGLFFYPVVFYFCIAIFYYLSLSKMPKNNNSILKFLTFIGILGFVISFPVSWYADSKLKENGYINCHKKSLNAPSKYVKNKNLCD